MRLIYTGLSHGGLQAYRPKTYCSDPLNNKPSSGSLLVGNLFLIPHFTDASKKLIKEMNYPLRKTHANTPMIAQTPGQPLMLSSPGLG